MNVCRQFESIWVVRFLEDAPEQDGERPEEVFLVNFREDQIFGVNIQTKINNLKSVYSLILSDQNKSNLLDRKADSLRISKEHVT